jgi:outer membrane protein TolC
MGIGWFIGPTVSWPIFDANALRNQVRVQTAQQEAALANYTRTVLLSLSDVENALTAFTQEQSRRQLLAQSVDANQRAVDLANQLYTRGLGDFLNVLDAERSLYAAQNDLTLSETAVSVDLVQLYKALGGGWEYANSPN